MGLHKKDHIRAILQMPRVSQAWTAKHARDWTEIDVESLFQKFIPLQMEVLPRHSELIPGVLAVVQQLRERGIWIAGTTGYFREAAELVAETARHQGYLPDLYNCPEDVSAGRPAPWMIYRSMEKFGIYPPQCVLKIGDTLPDIEEGLNAGVWTYGVTHSSSEVGCTLPEFESLAEVERKAKVQAASEKLLAAGAHGVISTVNETLRVIDELNAKMR
jgi:phosphonoacetaldehyde hydrolase